MKRSKSEYELYSHYKSEYDFLKKRLLSMDFPNNPVKQDEEYIEMLHAEIRDLKEENVNLRLELSNYKSPSPNIIDKIKDAFTKK